MTYYAEGICCLKAGRFYQGIAQLRMAADLDPHDEETFSALCLAAYEADLHDSTFETSMDRLWKSSGGAAFSRALALDSCRQGLSAEAIVYALESVFLDPEDTLSIYVLGLSYLAAEKYESAKRSFRRALELEPDFAIARSKLNLVSTRYL